MKCRSALLGLLLASGSALAAQPGCEQMLGVKVADARITAATQIAPAPVWNTPPAATNDNEAVPVKTKFCRLEGVIEQEIVFELWLPETSAWNGRFMGTGNGGDAGFINYFELARGVGRGFATASTNSGHWRTDARWGKGREDRVQNYGHRSQHLTAVHAKQIIDRYYGKTPSKSYFVGCSGGGSMGLMEAQGYAGDYDGVMAGAGGIGMLPLSTRIITAAMKVQKDPRFDLPPEKWQGVADAVVASCDTNDGVKDGVVDDPYACKFEAKQLLCDASAKPNCLTPQQVETVQIAYSPLRDEQGAQIDPGFPPGSQFRPIPRQIGTAALQFGDWTYQDPEWNVENLVLSRDLPAAEKKLPFLRFSNPNLDAFRKRGSKLITYQGYVDYIVPAGLTMQFNRDIVKRLGEKQTAEFFRMFMVPGMDHCRRGPGPESFGQAFRGDPPIVDAEHDMLSALMRWVEEGKAPDRIIASREKNGVVDRTRPLCPYPQRAVYKGAGSTDDASHFVCRAPG